MLLARQVWAHICTGAWDAIRGDIQSDTQSALSQWAAANNKTLPAYKDDKVVVIQLRWGWNINAG